MADRVVGGRAGRRLPVAVAWTALALVTIHACWGTLRHDYRDSTLVGDQASQLMQAVSLAYGGNLGYDQDDLDHYRDATWRVNYRPPVGLLFQRDGQGWASAKPYGYSLVAAPFLRALGPSRGIAVVDTILLLAVLAVTLALLRLRLSGVAVPITAGALVFASNVLPYAYVLYVELFTALVVGLAAYGLLRAVIGTPAAAARPVAEPAVEPVVEPLDGANGPTADASDPIRASRLLIGPVGWAILGSGALGLAVAEKGPLLIALGPLLIVVVVRQRSWAGRLLPLAAAVLVFGVAVMPYLATSNGASYTPYGGDRYASPGGGVPFSQPPAAPNRYQQVRTDETVSASYIRSQLRRGWADKARSAATYVVGRHTGVLVFMPVAVVAIALALARGRRLDLAAGAILLGLVGYGLFYVLLFSDNYYGGGQSFGNRYFVQICPLVAALAAAARIPARQLVIGSAASIAFALLVLWPNLLHPADAVERIDRTSAIQRLFPFESNQAGAIRFACGVTTPAGPREECNARYRASHGEP